MAYFFGGKIRRWRLFYAMEDLIKRILPIVKTQQIYLYDELKSENLGSY